MGYGFVVVLWKFYSAVAGALMLALTATQIVANLLTHPRKKTAHKSDTP